MFGSNKLLILGKCGFAPHWPTLLAACFSLHLLRSSKPNQGCFAPVWTRRSSSSKGHQLRNESTAMKEIGIVMNASARPKESTQNRGHLLVLKIRSRAHPPASESESSAAARPRASEL